MSDNTPTLADYARRMRSLVEEDIRIAADLRELAKEMRECGHRPVVIKAWVKALVLAEDYDNPKPLEALKERTQDAAMYGAALGIEIDGFEGEAKRNGVKDFGEPATGGYNVPTPHDTDRVVIEPTGAGNAEIISPKAEERNEFKDVHTPAAGAEPASPVESEDLYQQAKALVIADQKASASYIQRKLQIAYNPALRLLARMEAEGICAAPNSAGLRKMLVAADPAPTVSIVWPTEPDTTAAPSQGLTGSQPCEPSPDEVLAAAEAPLRAVIASQSERAPEPTPSREIGVTEDVPAFLRRQKVAAE